MHLMSWYTQYYKHTQENPTRTPVQLKNLDNHHKYLHLYFLHGICKEWYQFDLCCSRCTVPFRELF